MNSRHEGEGVNFPCDQCDYKATRKGHLLNHRKSRHEGVKFPCDQCDYKATERVNLLHHIRSIHAGVKFPCDLHSVPKRIRLSCLGTLEKA